MIAQRIIEIINLSRVPARYKRFWPQHAAVFVSKEGEILDVIQFYDTGDPDLYEVHALYPGSAFFLADVGMYQSPEEIEDKVRSCAAALKRKRPKGVHGALLNIEGKWVPSIGAEIDAKKRK
jgi:hypothetical protein